MANLLYYYEAMLQKMQPTEPNYVRVQWLAMQEKQKLQNAAKAQVNKHYEISKINEEAKVVQSSEDSCEGACPLVDEELQASDEKPKRKGRMKNGD